MSQLTEKPDWLTPKEGAGHARVSIKVFRSFYKKGNLRYIKLPNNRILIKRQWIDSYLESYEVVDQIKQIVEELTQAL